MYLCESILLIYQKYLGQKQASTFVIRFFFYNLSLLLYYMFCGIILILRKVMFFGVLYCFVDRQLTVYIEFDNAKLLLTALQSSNIYLNMTKWPELTGYSLKKTFQIFCWGYMHEFCFRLLFNFEHVINYVVYLFTLLNVNIYLRVTVYMYLFVCLYFMFLYAWRHTFS